MSIKDTIAAIRKEAGITQEEIARRLYVTRQAVSRWETGETTPGIDMVKLIRVTFGVPLERFFDMPMSYYCQCCSMPIPDEEMHGTEADGSKSADFCKYCYDQGDFTAKGMAMDEFIEATAPMEAKALGVSLDEAVSLMATLLPVDDDPLAAWRLRDDASEEMLIAASFGHLDEVVEKPAALLLLPVVVALVDGDHEARELPFDEVGEVLLVSVHWLPSLLLFAADGAFCGGCGDIPGMAPPGCPASFGFVGEASAAFFQGVHETLE